MRQQFAVLEDRTTWKQHVIKIIGSSTQSVGTCQELGFEGSMRQLLSGCVARSHTVMYVYKSSLVIATLRACSGPQQTPLFLPELATKRKF